MAHTSGRNGRFNCHEDDDAVGLVGHVDISGAVLC